MPTNQILPFATGVGANVDSQASYAANPNTSAGQQPGVASSSFNNKALRQACWMASVLAQFIANTSGSDVLDDANQTTLLAAMAATWPASAAPTVTKLTTTGSTTGYLFTVSTANATIGAVYANNGNNFTVLATLASGTQLFCSGASAPLSSGTLTKQSGTGDSTITFSAAQAMATYTTPANVKYLKVRLVGGGGGGGGSGSSGTGTAGGNGTITAFGSALLVAKGGNGGSATSGGAIGGAGGTASLGTGPVGAVFAGGNGQGGSYGGTSGGGNGGVTPFGGAGSGPGLSNNGSDASTNSGSGGGGAGATNAGGTQYGGSGGGAGGYVDSIITSVAATYFYAVGAGGAGGTGAQNGGAGAAGIIIVEEHYGS